LIVSPTNETCKGLPKFKKGFVFITDEIKVMVVDSTKDVVAFESPSDVWVRAFVSP
jgi:hypothetical protein